MTDPDNRFVYFALAETGLIKIGCSVNPRQRVITLASETGVRHRLLAQICGSTRLENHIHRHLASSLSHREWFRPTLNVLAMVADIQSGVFVDPIGPCRPHAPRVLASVVGGQTLRRRRTAIRAAA